MTTNTPARSDASPNLEFEPFALLTHLLSKTGLILTFAVMGAGAGAIYTAVVGFNFESQSVFRPAASDPALGRMTGIAAQLGFALPIGGGGAPLEFYSRLVESNTILAAVAFDTFTVRTSEGTATGRYIDLVGLADIDSAEITRASVLHLKDQIETRLDASAGVVELTTVASTPDLSVNLNRRLLTSLEAFNRRQLQQQASAERVFVEGRAQDVGRTLQSAENSLKHFLERNRTYQTSPDLVVEYGRLQRTLDLAQQVYVSLSQSLEQARIEEVRNTPVITVVDAPEVAVQPTSSWARRIILGAMLGAILSIGGIALQAFMRLYGIRDPAGYAKLPKLTRLIH